MSSGAAALAALRRGIRYLAESQGDDGAWRDFRVDGGDVSDEWVTAYVGMSLRLTGTAAGFDVSAATGAACEFLLARGVPRRGWGFNGRAPVDADSTAWALRFLHACDRAAPADARWLLRFRKPGGGFATYDQFTNDDATAPCAEIVAIALDVFRCYGLAAEARACTEFLARPSTESVAYWYTTPLYARCIAARAGVRAVGATAWTHEDEPSQADVFATALAVELDVLGVSSCGTPARLRERLLAAQKRDGRWAGAPFMRPDPWNYRRGEPGSAIADQHALFTTATVVRALGEAARAEAA